MEAVEAHQSEHLPPPLVLKAVRLLLLLRLQRHLLMIVALAAAMETFLEQVHTLVALAAGVDAHQTQRSLVQRAVHQHSQQRLAVAVAH